MHTQIASLCMLENHREEEQPRCLMILLPGRDELGRKISSESRVYMPTNASVKETSRVNIYLKLRFIAKELV